MTPGSVSDRDCTRERVPSQAVTVPPSRMPLTSRRRNHDQCDGRAAACPLRGTLRELASAAPGGHDADRPQQTPGSVDHEDALFGAVLGLCARAGLVSDGVVAIEARRCSRTQAATPISSAPPRASAATELSRGLRSHVWTAWSASYWGKDRPRRLPWPTVADGRDRPARLRSAPS